MPAFSQERLKRRSAISKGSLSFTLTCGIESFLPALVYFCLFVFLCTDLALYGSRARPLQGVFPMGERREGGNSIRLTDKLQRGLRLQDVALCLSAGWG